MLTFRRLLHRMAIASVLCAAAMGLASNPAQARVFFGVGIPFYGPGFYPPPVYYPPPPVYYAPPPVVYAPPPQVYAPPPSGYSAPSAGGGQSCYAASYVCPMDRPVASGAGCYCLSNGGQRVWGRAN